MDLDEIISYLAGVGALLTVVSFLIYVFNPDSIFLYLFIVGVVLLIGGYTVTGGRIRILNKEINLMLEEEDSDPDGFIISLDGPYHPEGDDAIIETLE